MPEKIKIPESEIQRRKKACECDQFDPHNCDDISSYRTCSVNEALKNHVSFPSMLNLVQVDVPSNLYLHSEAEKKLLVRHWCLLIDIYLDASTDETFICHGFDQFGMQVITAFYPQLDIEPTTFSWDHLKPGYTLAILYAEKTCFPDGKEGIKQQQLNNCFIFKAPLSKVQEEAQKLLDNADANNVNEIESCFECSKKMEGLKQCSKCKLAKYCSQDCQIKHWSSTHKKLCTQSENLLRLSALPRQIRRFQNYACFQSDATNYLPAYGSR